MKGEPSDDPDTNLDSATGSGLTVPLVSVIVPTRDRAGLLPRAIESVLGQKMGDLELVVVDDGSTDATVDLAGAFTDPRVRWVRQEHAGVSAARNRGASCARGEWLAFLDDDDEWLPTLLAHLVGLAERTDLAAIACFGVEVEASGRRRRPQSLPDPDPVVATTHGWYPFTGGFLVRRSAFIATGGYPQHLSHREDWYQWLALVLAFRGQIVAEPLMLRHLHEGPQLSRRLADTRAAAFEMDRRFSAEVQRRLGYRAAMRWFWQNCGRDEFRFMLARYEREGRPAAWKSLIVLTGRLPRSASTMWRPALVLVLGREGYFRLHDYRLATWGRRRS